MKRFTVIAETEPTGRTIRDRFAELRTLILETAVMIRISTRAGQSQNVEHREKSRTERLWGNFRNRDRGYNYRQRSCFSFRFFFP